MRQQLIQWLTEDIAPEFNRSKDARGTMLKFAREKNLSAAQLEALGQLFNTAKTINHLDKSANRGADFPIVDVPEMVSEFMEVEPKKASFADAIDETPHANRRMPDAFSGISNVPLAHINEYEEQIIPANPRTAERQKSAAQSISKVEGEILAQIRFDTLEDMRKLSSDIRAAFRENPELKFEDIEADVWALHGDTIKPATDAMATYLADDGMPIKRASSPSNGLIREQSVMVQIEKFRELQYFLEAADDQIKNASATAEQFVSDQARSTPGPGAGDTGADDPVDNFLIGHAPTPVHKTPHSGGSPPGKTKSPSAPGQAKGKDDYFGQLESKMDGFLSPAAQSFQGAAGKAFGGINNRDQRVVDDGHRDVRQLAMLQNLMTTDDVLAEADPEHVVSLFNSIRSSAPELAGDINVMRVALRSAVQHDGFSPFDLKTFLDTEMAHQRTDLNRRQLQGHLYRGQPLGPAPKGQ